MSKYYVNKFLFTVDRDPELLRRYKEEPRAFVATWEQSIGPRLNDAERSTRPFVDRRRARGASSITTSSSCSNWAPTSSCR